MKRGERSPEAEKRYKKLQRKKKRYMELREELQVEGIIPVEPDGAIRNERVDPATQGEQHLPALVGQAVRRGWAVPEEKKPRLVDEMVSIIDDPDESNKVKVAAFNALRQADQAQFERDNPEKAGKTGSSVTVPVNVSVSVGDVFDDIERDTRIILGKAGGHLQADRPPEPLDAQEPNNTEAQPEANRLPDAG